MALLEILGLSHDSVISISEGRLMRARVLRSLILLIIERALINMNDMLLVLRCELMGSNFTVSFSILWDVLCFGRVSDEACVLGVLMEVEDEWEGLKK